MCDERQHSSCHTSSVEAVPRDAGTEAVSEDLAAVDPAIIVSCLLRELPKARRSPSQVTFAKRSSRNCLLPSVTASRSPLEATSVTGNQFVERVKERNTLETL
ncbi:hypothetical protein NDU88_000808 [Pleurodeles waltl]|uniref:Uncharacterized protein n=1 Tax=Pleurodeles waltl TaxID=8319 RepID=A0AAV7PAR0_PLEWA|nr:hypothetical protein NDU88_000808 [Pleurodeles waltl]